MGCGGRGKEIDVREWERIERLVEILEPWQRKLRLNFWTHKSKIKMSNYVRN